MRRGIYLLAVLVLCAAFCGYSKSVTEDNYVRTWVYLDNTGNDSRARISTDPGVDANGDTIVKNINRYKSVSHTYLGSFDYDGYYSGFRIVTPVGLYDSKAKKHYWNITNHQGSVMAVVDSDGKVAQRSGLYPSGTPFTLPVDFAADTVTMRAGAIDERLHIGNRWLSHSGLNWYDNTARMHDPLLCRFTTPDPLAVDYTSSSPWTHCLANPANILDPDGCRIEGISKKDINQFFDQIKTVLHDDKFKPFINTLSISGKKLNVDKKTDIHSVVSAIDMSEDENCFVYTLVESIAEKSKIKVEYIENNECASEDGLNYIRESSVAFSGLKAVNKNLLNPLGGALTTATKSGAYTLMLLNSPDTTPNTFHEVLGHGLSLVNGLDESKNNTNAIRMDNVVRRILNMNERDGSDHPGLTGDPTLLPNYD
ncbi:MAG: RHS repeat domain-containing protein [Muribaculaceae bacterium]